MKHLTTFILIILFPLFSFGQDDYFVIDNVINIMNVLDNGDLINGRICQVKTGREIIEYTPYEVSEYGFKNGQVYVSKEIQLADSAKRVFLERLHNGETNLYFYRGKTLKTFYIEKDSTLFVELPEKSSAKEHYSKSLLNLTRDCQNVTDASKLVAYNKRSLTKFIARYNACELKPFPHFKYGIVVGFGFYKLVPSYKTHEQSPYLTINRDSEFDYFDYEYDSKFSVGVFIDNPILASDFSIHTELLFSKYKNSYSYTSATKKINLKVDLTTLTVPVLLRYTFPVNNFRPYLNLGPSYSYHLKNESVLHKSFLMDDNPNEFKNTTKESVIPSHEIGYAIGGGFEFDLDYRRAIFFEVRYENQFGISGDFSSSNSMVKFLTGISF